MDYYDYLPNCEVCHSTIESRFGLIVMDTKDGDQVCFCSNRCKLKYKPKHKVNGVRDERDRRRREKFG